jgi:nitrogen regulatory protein P-II 1
MRMIVAVIQPTKLQAVRDALQRIGVERMTVCDALGYGRQRGMSATYRGVEYRAELIRKVTLEIVVNEDFLERTLDVLTTAARTGSTGTIGDGKIFVLPAMDAIDLATGNQGPAGVN